MSGTYGGRLGVSWASGTEARIAALEQRLTDGAAMSGSWEILKLHAVVAAHTLRIAALEQRPECPCARLCVPESDATAPSGPTDHLTPETAQGQVGEECDGGFNCQAPLHVHGCYSDLGGNPCDDPNAHYQRFPTPETAQGHTVGVAEYNRGFNAGWLAKQGWLYRHR